MRLRAAAAFASFFAVAIPLACDSFDEPGASADAGLETSSGAETSTPAIDSAAPADAGASCAPGSPVPDARLAPKLFAPQELASAMSCIADGGAELGNGLAAEPAGGGVQVKGCAGVDLGALRLLSQVDVELAALSASDCSGATCDACDAGASASLYLLTSPDDATWAIHDIQKSPAIDAAARAVTFDVSRLPPMRYLAFCRHHLPGPVLRVANVRAICR